MKRHQANPQTEKVWLSLTAALVWVIAGVTVALAASPALGGVRTDPGQRPARTARRPATKPLPVPVLTGLSPNSAPQGGVGEIVLTGKNFVRGMRLDLGCAKVSSLKVESAQRAVAQIRADLNEQEGPCNVGLEYIPLPLDETAESPQGTLEVAQVAKSATFAILNDLSSPFLVELGNYILFPEEEINILKSQAATGKQMQQTAEANKLSKDQEQNMKKQGDDLKELQAKYKRGEITQAEYMAAAMKAASGMMAQMTPQQKAAMGQQRAAVAQTAQGGQKLLELSKQEKEGQLRLQHGSLSFLAGKEALLTEPLSALQEITVAPDPEKKVSHQFELAFSGGKKYFLRSHDAAEPVVSRLKKRLGK